MSGLFGEIFEAIQYLRQEKGTTEKAILMYVRERTGNSLSIGKVSRRAFVPHGTVGRSEYIFEHNRFQLVKTLRTIDRLVEEGRLVRKGRRIVLPFSEKKEEEGEEKGNNEVDGNKECQEEEDEEEEEEDDESECEDKDEEDEEDEDEEDDDDDDDCSNDNKNTASKTGNGNGNSNNSCPTPNSPDKVNEDAEWSNKYINKMKSYAKCMYKVFFLLYGATMTVSPTLQPVFNIWCNWAAGSNYCPCAGLGGD